MAIDYVEQTIDSGVTPIEIEYCPIRSTSNDRVNGLRTVVKINSVTMGTLYPQQYRIVTNRNAQCIRLAKRTLNQLEEDIPYLDEKGALPPFVTVYIPTKMLMKDHLQKHLQIMKNREFGFFKNLCLEFSSDLLLEDSEKVKEKIEEIQNEFSVKFALSEYGDSFCPVLRIKGLPLQYVILDETVYGKECFESDQMKMLIRMLSSSDITICSEAVFNQEDIDAAYSADVDYYIDRKGLPVSEVSQ